MELGTSCLLREGAQQNGTAVALSWIEDGRLVRQTYEELDREVSSLARELAGEIQATRVGLLVDDPGLLLRLAWALFRTGAEVVFLSSRLPVTALRALCELASCGTVVTDRTDVFVGAGPVEMRFPRVAVGVGSNAARRVGDLDAFSRARTVLFTSGSSGAPRGVRHGIRAHVFSAAGSNENIRLKEGNRWLLALPQYHVSGLSIAFRCFAAGAAVAIAPTQALYDNIRLLGATHVSLVTTQLGRLVRSAQERGATLAGLNLLVGGGPVPTELSANAVSLGARVFVSYGMSEMASQITTTDGSGSPDELATSGRPLPYRKVRIARSGDRDTGLIEVAGETLFDGYLGADAPGPRDGWFTTGDVGMLDHEGRLTVVGRADRMFISGGENIHPEQIERLMLKHPDINRVAVVPVSDAEYGFRPVAFVDPALDQATAAVVNDTLSENLPRYALPVAHYPFQSDAETSISKLDYQKLAGWAECHRMHSRES